MERLQSTLSRCLRRLGVTAPSAPTTIGTTFTDFRCQSFFISLLRSWYLRILSSSLVFIRVSPGTAISTITAVASFFTAVIVIIIIIISYHVTLHYLSLYFDNVCVVCGVVCVVGGGWCIMYDVWWVAW